MGRVYRVRHVDLGKTFALKIMRSALGNDDRARQSFFREARLASTLSHPQIVSVVDYGEDPSYGAFMVMEHLEGQPLKKLIAQAGQVPPRQACELICLVADAIRYVHDNGIIHCDIKPENILVSEERSEQGRRMQRVKLLDFGLARSNADPNQSANAIDGTPTYLAPERLKGAVPAPSMDIYSLGILFYEVLTGAPPFSGNLHTVLTCHLVQEPTHPSLIVSGLDERIEAVVLKSIEKEPEARQKNVAAFLYELKTAMSMMGWISPRRARPQKKSRDEALAVAGFMDSPVPLAVFNVDGTIVASNRSFATFLTGSPADLDGISIAETALVQVYPQLGDELRSVGSSGSPKKVGLKVADSAGNDVTMLVWLTPIFSDVRLIHCAIHPLG